VRIRSGIEGPAAARHGRVSDCLHDRVTRWGCRTRRSSRTSCTAFHFGGDIAEYFNRYRRKLSTRDDIRKNSGLSDADRARLTELTKAR
jgi:hypothetical protein